VIFSVESDGYLRPPQVLRGSGADWHDLSYHEHRFRFALIGVMTVDDVVDLLAILEEVVLRVFYFLLLLDLLSQFEDFIGEALQLLVVPSLVLSLRVENANSIQETLLLAWSELVLSLVMARPFHVGNRAAMLPFLVIGL
jgi:hypothetical protein